MFLHAVLEQFGRMSHALLTFFEAGHRGGLQGAVPQDHGIIHETMIVVLEVNSDEKNDMYWFSNSVDSV